MHGSLDPQESVPKWHLDWFSRFCIARPCDQHTDSQTMLCATAVAIGRILCTACRSCGLMSNSVIKNRRRKNYWRPIQICQHTLWQH